MERKQRAGILVIFGTFLFLASMFLVLPIPEFYLLALILMFLAIICIGVGGASIIGLDKELDHPDEECYLCSGTGKAKDGDGVCSRCGGTGVTPPEVM